MNKYDSKTGVTMFLLMALLCFVTIFFYIFWATSGIWIPAIIFTVLLLLGYVPIYFFTNYEIDSTYVYMRKGFVAKKIPLEKIEAVYPTKNWIPSFATSYQRIAIVYTQDGKTKKTYVSPFLYSAFLNDLTDMTLDNVILSQPTEQKEITEQQAKLQEEKTVETAKSTAQTQSANNTKSTETKIVRSKTKQRTTKTTKAGRPRKTATAEKKKAGRPKKQGEKQKAKKTKKS